MKINELLAVLEEMAPLAYAEDFDNVGLLVGDRDRTATGILVCHDALEEVIDEAIAKQCNLVVCFHPILFSGIKKITGADYVERALLKAIRNDIAIYAVHTALDNHKDGVNKIFCDALGLQNCRVLLPKKQFIYKLVTFVPEAQAQALLDALFAAGAGNIGNYEQCSFSSGGIGTFMGNEDSNPQTGNRFELVKARETKIEVTFEKHKKSKILKALFSNHPYEEVAYECHELLNEHQGIGLGMVGELGTARSGRDFLQLVKDAMRTEGIRHSAVLEKNIQTVAVLGGSGSFAIKAAKQAGADAFVTADLKYHQFYEADGQMMLLDIGHFESERFTKNYIVDFLSKKIPNFAIILSEVNTNPVKYF